MIAANNLCRQQGQQQHDTRRTTSPAMSIIEPKKTSTATAALRLLTLAISLLLPLSTNAETYEVSPDGDPYSIAEALAEAGPGDTVSLEDGTYEEPIVTVAGGTSGNPLVIEGGRGAVINAPSGNIMVYVRHSWVTLEGFAIDALVDSSASSKSSYVDKCVYVEGQENSASSPLTGFVMRGLSVKNCGGECVRLKNFVTNSEVTGNVIEACGVYDFRFDAGGLNGEAIYIGTSSNQWDDGPDGTNNNVISRNVLRPVGSECIEVKEGATGNTIEENECKEQLDPNSGCYGLRGSGNIFRNNAGSKCAGAGIRLGGWEEGGVQYGIDNDVYGNTFTETAGGAIAIRALPQGQICGNTCDTEDGGSCDINDGNVDIEESWNRSC